MSKRAATIFRQAKARSDEARPEPEDDEGIADEVPMAGNWSRIAFRGMEEKLKGKTEELDLLKAAQIEGVLNGSIPVVISPEMIFDEVGSDRIAQGGGNSEDPSTFEALVKNIEDRGQRVPIRVRPQDPEWRPDPESPQDVSGQKFLLQSGRRRLAACVELGRDVIAFLSFPDDGLASIDDLHERYFENVSRRDLSTGEKWFSIGYIAENMPGLDQSQVAEILQVAQPTVSRGVSLYRNYDAIKDMVDLATAGKRQLEAALKTINSNGKTQEASSRPALPELPFSKQKIGRSTLNLTRSKTGVHTLTIKAENLDDLALEEVVKILERGQK